MQKKLNTERPTYLLQERLPTVHIKIAPTFEGCIATRDSGTVENWISQDIVDRFRLEVRKGLLEEHTTFDGKTLSSCETVQPTWCLRGSHKSYKCEFRVASDPPFDVLFGWSFLKRYPDLLDSEDAVSDDPLLVLVQRKKEVSTRAGIKSVLSLQTSSLPKKEPLNRGGRRHRKTPQTFNRAKGKGRIADRVEPRVARGMEAVQRGTKRSQRDVSLMEYVASLTHVEFRERFGLTVAKFYSLEWTPPEHGLERLEILYLATWQMWRSVLRPIIFLF